MIVILRSFFLFGLLLSLNTQAEEARVIRLAVSSSLESSGLLNALNTRFTAATGHKLELTVVGSGRALKLARNGRQDVIWVHAPDAEARFIRDGFGHSRHPVLRNDFILVGPANDPAQISNLMSAVAALRSIYLSASSFVSRGDDSGNHQTEKGLWALADLDPLGSNWYIETGLNMPSTLRRANRENAYLLTDRATFYAKGGSRLRVLLENDGSLTSLYSVIAVNPERIGGVNFEGAMRFIAWLLTAETQAFITHFGKAHQPLFSAVE